MSLPAGGDIVRPEDCGGGVIEGGSGQTKVTDLEPEGERGSEGRKGQSEVRKDHKSITASGHAGGDMRVARLLVTPVSHTLPHTTHLQSALARMFLGLRSR